MNCSSPFAENQFTVCVPFMYLYVVSRSVVSDSLRPHGLQPTRLFRHWNSPGKILEWIAILFSNVSVYTHSYVSIMLSCCCRFMVRLEIRQCQAMTFFQTCFSSSRFFAYPYKNFRIILSVSIKSCCTESIDHFLIDHFRKI